MDEPAPVSLADAEVAAGIARAARKGRGADRAPTLEQLLAAFGEHEPTPDARRRVKAALEVADVRVKPDLEEAAPGQRVLLQVRGGGGSGSGRALGGLLALAAVLAVAAVAATIAGQDDKSAGDDLPADTGVSVTAPPTTPPAATTAPEDGGATATTAPEDGATTTTTTPATTTPADEPSAAERRAAERERRRRAAARKRVTVRLTATQPTFLCVEDEDGLQLFGGTLTGRQTFKGDDLRFNIGLASTEVRVNGKVVPLQGSPTGIRVTRKGTTVLASGQRPC
ncbi:MAG: hypothetical protein HZB46_07830 [Solirubrobacterales bacterium]|nr:hypothetical protein [Solirubrobacterales bacterium]